MQRREFIKSGVMAAGAMAVPNILRAPGSQARGRRGTPVTRGKPGEILEPMPRYEKMYEGLRT